MSQPLSCEVIPLSDLEMAWKTNYLKAIVPASLINVFLPVRANLTTGVSPQPRIERGAEAGAFLSASIVLPTQMNWSPSSTSATVKNVLTENTGRAVWPELKVLSDVGRGHVVFHPPTHTLFRVNAQTATILKAGLEGQRHLVAQDEIEALIAHIQQVVDSRPPLAPAGEASRSLRKLVLNVSNDCNLRCRYCYAQGGHYGQPRALMSPETICQAIDRLFEYYADVAAVMFFGGEPTLNPKAIQAGCDRLLQLHEQGRITRLPSWGMVTNGLVLTERMLDLIQRYQLVVTVSLDGPAPLNDFLRPTSAGQGSYQRIARNIHRLQALTDGREPSKIEATYTAAHGEAGLALHDLADYFSRELGIQDVHIAPIAVDQHHDLRWAPQAEDLEMIKTTVAGVIESWLTEQPRQLMSLAECLHPIVTRQPSSYRCSAGLSELTVQANGEIYACYQLQADEFRIGNVADPNVFESEQFSSLQQRMRNLTKAQLSQCHPCWARHLCRACIGIAYRESHTIDRIPDHVCAVNQAIAESALLTLSRLQEDPEKWSLLCTHVGEMIGANVSRQLRLAQ